MELGTDSDEVSVAIVVQQLIAAALALSDVDPEVLAVLSSD